MVGRQYISKGFYLYKQPSEFVTLQNYIYVRVGKKKCLILRFFNEIGYTVNEMEFALVQLDAAGKVIKTSNIKYSDIQFESEQTFVPKQGIVVDDFCTDFRIVISSVRSDRYKYTVKNGKVKVKYIKRSKQLGEGILGGEIISGHRANSVKFAHPRSLLWLTLASAFALLLTAAFSLYSQI